MAGRFILALDQGTSSSRALVVDGEGRIAASASRAFPQIFPRPGWVEHDPEQIWQSQLGAAYDALKLAGASAEDIAAIGIANQRETTIVWERRSGRPIANAIVWQCRRTADDCERMRSEGLEPLVHERTGLLLDAYFSGTKVAWFLDNVPSARDAAEAGLLAFGTVDSWLIHRLTGGRVHATDHTNASRTLLYNLRAGAWDPELCALFRVPMAVLPPVQPSGSRFGETDTALFGRPVPICGVAGDQQAALYGQACYEPGATKNTYGTGCFVLRHTGSEPSIGADGLLATAAASTAPERLFATEGSIFVAGAAVQWLRDGLRLITSAAEVEPLAASVPDAGGVLFVPAFVGLGAPYWDPYARGTLIGITRGTTAAHVARATLEAIAFQTVEVLELFDRETGVAGDQLRVDGGAAANDLLMQLQADLLGSPVVRPRVAETTALGAAYLAGITAGVWRDEQETASLWQIERTFEPSIEEEARRERLELWRAAVGRSRSWATPSQEVPR
jgi:glycerol kinase